MSWNLDFFKELRAASFLKDTWPFSVVALKVQQLLSLWKVNTLHGVKSPKTATFTEPEDRECNVTVCFSLVTQLYGKM